MTLVEEITNRLQSLAPTALSIEDESHLHAGHQGNGGGGHFKLNIVSPHFNNISQVSRHRLIYQSLNDLIPNKVHALSIQARALNE